MRKELFNKMVLEKWVVVEWEKKHISLPLHTEYKSKFQLIT